MKCGKGRLVAGILCLLLQTGAVSADVKNLIFVLDASGSMWGQLEGRNKIVIEREVLGDLIRNLPEDSNTALIAYGHRRKGDCADIETLTTLGPVDKPGLTAIVNRLNPTGKTPLTDAVKAALELVDSGDNPTIILISDGLDNCGGDPCKAVADATASGSKFLMQVIGFGIQEESVAQLECTAQAGGGLYFDAKNAAELSAALEQVVKQPAVITGGRLSITTLTNGQLSDAAISITKTGEAAVLASGRTYTGAQTNPRMFTLPAGEYDVTLRGLRIDGDVERRFEGVEIFGGEALEREVEFSTGKLSVKVVMNDKPGEALVQVTRSSDGSQVAEGRTYISGEHNPALFELTSGSYDVSVKPVKSKGSVEKHVAGIEVAAGATVEREVVYGTGKLTVKVTRNGALSDARVDIFEPGGKKPIAQGRTHTSAKNNPKQFVLESGSYDIVIDSLEIKGGKQQRFENIVLDPKGETQQFLNFESGSLAVEALFDGKPADAIFSVTSAEQGILVDNVRTHSRSKALVLPPGEYKISVKGVKLKGDPRAEIYVTLKTGQLLEQRVELKTVE